MTFKGSCESEATRRHLTGFTAVHDENTKKEAELKVTQKGKRRKPEGEKGLEIGTEGKLQ